ncbi:MAG: NAD(P)H-dependent oxidoreductase subunit E [Planctomycetota bacterium]|nr:MAG: NAD(P)H-dependent oxidoreductase subunit E [Planctomycetota bacterium]
MILTEQIRERIRAEFPKYPDKRAVVLPALHIVHDELRSVPHAAIEEIAGLLEIHPAEIHDTMSFYQFFREEDRPLGKRRVWVCRSLSCALRGGEELLESLSHKWRVAPGGTTDDGRVSLEYAECLGACEGAPCVLVNDECHMNVSAEDVEQIVGE